MRLTAPRQSPSNRFGPGWISSEISSILARDDQGRARHQRPSRARPGARGRGVPGRLGHAGRARSRRCRAAGRRADGGHLVGGGDGARRCRLHGLVTAVRRLSGDEPVRVAGDRLPGVRRTAAPRPDLRRHRPAVPRPDPRAWSRSAERESLRRWGSTDPGRSAWFARASTPRPRWVGRSRISSGSTRTAAFELCSPVR